MLEDGGGIRSQELLVFAKPDNEWDVATCSNEHVRMFLADDGDGVGASYLLQSQAYCRFEIVLCYSEVGVFDQVRENFSICFGAEGMPIAFQFCTQFYIVLDDAVVDDGQSTCAIWMGMRIGVVRASMRRPACMTDAGRPLDRLHAFAWTIPALDGGDQIGDFSSTTADFEVSCGGENCNACGVVSAIFEFVEAIKQQRSNIGALCTDVTNDTTHGVGYPFMYKK